MHPITHLNPSRPSPPFQSEDLRMLRQVEREGEEQTPPWTLEPGAGPATLPHPLFFLSAQRKRCSGQFLLGNLRSQVLAKRNQSQNQRPTVGHLLPSPGSSLETSSPNSRDRVVREDRPLPTSLKRYI